MDGIAYRLALPEDARAMAEIRMDMLLERNEGGHDREMIDLLRKNNVEYFKRCLADGSAITWLAHKGYELVGTGSVSYSVNPPNFHCPSGRTAYIANIYTKPGYRQQGIASETLRRCVESAKARGCERITLNATAAGRPLYEKFGFKTSANAMSYYPNDHAVEGSN